MLLLLFLYRILQLILAWVVAWMLAGVLVETLHWILAQDSREDCVMGSEEDSALDFD